MQSFSLTITFFSEKRGRQIRDLMEMWCGSSGDGVEGEGINLVKKKKNEKKIW